MPIRLRSALFIAAFVASSIGLGVALASMGGDEAPATDGVSTPLAAEPGEPPSDGAERAGERLVFGESVEGRRLLARRVGDPRSDRTALIVGEIHGDESAGRPVLRTLRRRPGAARDVDLWTVGTINPDGHADDSRANANGVDLNRNFSVGWDGSEPEGSGYFPGPGPFSEPESRALRDLIRRIDPDVTIHYHQPWGSVLAACAGPVRAERLYSTISGLPLERCRGQGLPGTITRWQDRRGGTAFVVEIGPKRLSEAGVRRHARAAAGVAAAPHPDRSAKIGP